MRISRLALAILAFGLINVSHADDKQQFTAADIHPTEYPSVRGLKHMGELISQHTNGRLTLKVVAGGSLGQETDILDQVRQGSLPMARVSITPLTNLCPDTVVPTMPFVFRDKEHLRRFMDGPVGEDILHACEAQGLILLGYYDAGARSLYGKRAFKTPADLKGVRLRIPHSEMLADFFRAMGAAPQPMPLSDIGNALKTGLIDAAENNIPTYDEYRHSEAAPIYSRTEHSMAPDVIVFSKTIFDRLPKSDQNTLRQAARDSMRYQRRLWDEKEKDALAHITTPSVRIVDVDRRAFQDACLPVYDKYIRTERQRALLKAIQNLQ